MAGDLMGDRSPAALPASPELRHVRRDVSRTRINHGTQLLGDLLASVYSSRRVDDDLGVLLELGAGAMVLKSRMRPGQARALARALNAAAVAFEAAEQRERTMRRALQAVEFGPSVERGV